MRTFIPWFLGTVLVFAGALSASDWPQFKRDSARTGDAPDAVLTFPLSRVVAVKLPAPIYASPAVVAGKIYIQDARGHVACVDAATNAVAWLTKIDGVTNMSSPAVADGKVFVGSSAGYLAVLDAKDGKLLKKVPAEGGVIAAPAVANDAVYFTSLDGDLCKIDYSGTLIWKFDGGERGHLESAVRGREILFFSGPYPQPATVACNQVLDEGSQPKLVARHLVPDYATSGPVFAEGNRYAYQRWHAEAGSAIVNQWDQDHKLKSFANGEEVIDSRAVPSVRGDRFFIAHRSGLRCLAQTSKPGDAKLEMKVEWQSGGWPYYGPKGHNSSPALGKEFLAVGCDDGRVYFYRVAKDPDEQGKPSFRQKPVWSFETVRAGKANSSITSSVALADNSVFFGGEDGILYGLGKGAEVRVVTAVRDEKPYEWPGVKLKGHEWPTARGGMEFSAVSPDTTLKPPLKLKWRTRIWGSFKGSVTVADGKVFAASRHGQTAALDAETGEIIWRNDRPFTNTFPAPSYVNKTLLTFCDGIVYSPKEKWGGGVWAFDSGTGALLWRKPQPVPTGSYDAAAGIVAQPDRALLCWDGGDGSIMTGAYELRTGKPIWEIRREGAYPATLKGFVHLSQGALGDGTWFCAFVKHSQRDIAQERATAAPVGATSAIDPKDGKLLWKNSDAIIHHFLGKHLAYRKGQLVVFGENDAFALDPKNGQLLWKGKTNSYMHPLTDRYLESKGQEEAIITGCGYYVYDNGFWYGIRGYGIGNPFLTAKHIDPAGHLPVDWSFGTMSRACPTAAPAYGRLYYAPNCEGMVYCFENAAVK